VEFSVVVVVDDDCDDGDGDDDDDDDADCEWEGIRKRTGVDWGCDPLSLENGTLLKEWLSTEGLAKQKLELERVESGGRGLVAKQSLRQGERLLFVPSRLIITAQSV
jgi:hypothetical protein